ncbi:beta-lactamase-like protein [Aspergillus granulosus]|uniref:ribonuclease Z n=1 Tax=Aspergillus granulosus TaxID=176169 RepID=A0ABR4H1K8_9EURO
MKFYYQILTTPTADTPGTTVLVHFDSRRYLFGQISEGTQRACNENAVKTVNVSDIFLTGRMEWSNTGGLLGMILTLADALGNSLAAREEKLQEKKAKSLKRGDEFRSKEGGGADGQQSLTIHGPKNLTHTLATARKFIFRKGLPLYTKEYSNETTHHGTKKEKGRTNQPIQPTYVDRHINVWAIPVSSKPASPPPSPRKRSLDDFKETRPIPLDAIDEDQVKRQSIVADMFSSSWSLDALVETPLADVKMPAQLFVRNPETKDLDKYYGPMPGSGARLPDIKVFVRKPWPGATVDDIPLTKPYDESLCYVIKAHDVRGKFDAAKAMALNVEKGPKWGQLSDGQSVTSKDGKVVTPDMVLGPTRPGKGLAIIHLPTPDYIDNLADRPEWTSSLVTSNLEAFIWITGPGVWEHPRLQEFVARMRDSQHIVSSTDCCPNSLTMHSSAGTTIRMARLRPDNYLVPVHDNRVSPLRPQSPSKAENKPPPVVLPAEPGLVVDMQPNFGINHSQVVPHLNTSLILQQMPKAAMSRANTISKRLQKQGAQEKLRQFLKDLPCPDAEIITLGTGSSIPSKYRNVSSTLLYVPGQGYYLFDCGEGTLGQLKRAFTSEKLQEVLRNLRLVWISHLHADHHLGTASVLKAWYQANYPGGVPRSNAIEMDMVKILQDKRLFLVSEPGMIQWLEEYASVEDFGFAKMTPLSAFPYKEYDQVKTTFQYRHCAANGNYPGRGSAIGKPKITELQLGDNSTAPELTRLLQQATGLSDLLTTLVSHCNGAMAVSLVFPNGFKASFSGDCRPSPSFAAIGKDSTVLIHEATFSEDMIGSAIAKKHSTVGEAIEVGRQMRARSILLTHFSQRYQKMGITTAQQLEEPQQGPVDTSQQEDLVSEDLIKASTNADKPPPTVVPVVKAFDHMRVRVGDMFTLAAYSPATDRLFMTIERVNEELAAIRREQTEKDLAESSKKKGKKGKKGQKEQKEATSPPQRSASPPNSPKKSPRKSIWDASDSESGWSTSDDESPKVATSSAP